MNEDIFKGKWKQISGGIKEKWGGLTGDDIGKTEGRREYLLGKVTEYYSLAKDKIARHLKG